jgi:ligand-binding SRPBCC domain-containing protein
MYAGQIISYTIKPLLNYPLEWVTEITHVEKPYYFVDEQVFGPFKFWHHEHHFSSIENGILMTDNIYYKLPFGPIGKMAHYFKIKKDLETIFSFRQKTLEKKFGRYPIDKSK